MSQQNSPLRFIVSLAVALYGMASVPILLLAGLLLVHAETCQGRLFAVAVIAGLPAPVLLWAGKQQLRTDMVLNSEMNYGA